MIDDRLAITVTHADGTEDRWGPDEPDGHDVPDDLTFSTVIPGGYKDCTCSLARDLKVYSDEQLFDDILVYGPGGNHAWNGRMSHFPRDVGKVSPTAVGYSSHMDDDTTAREIYVDRDLSQWGDPPLDEKVYRASTTTYSLVGPVQALSVVSTEFQAPWTSATVGLPLAEAWYDSHGIPIGSLYFAWQATGGNVNPADPNWSWNGVLADTDQLSNTPPVDLSPNQRGTGPGTGTLTATPVPSTRKFAVAMAFYGGGPVTGNAIYSLYWTVLAVYGTHGLPKQGVADTLNAQGFLVSDIVANIIKRWAPQLTYTYPGSIEQTSFIVPHFAQYTMTTATDLVTKVNAFELRDWGVYSGGEEGWPKRTFFLRNPNPTRLTWRARRSDGATLTNEGIQAEQVVNGVIVNFTGPDGKTYTAGPPGSGCDFTNPSLIDTDPTNPVNAHGIIRRYGILNASSPTTSLGAMQLGAVWLSQRLGIQRRGTMNLIGPIKHPSGAYYPLWRVRAGDYIIMEDDPRDTEPRKIINTNYTHSSRTMQCDLEHDAFRIDALMERASGELIGVN